MYLVEDCSLVSISQYTQCSGYTKAHRQPNPIEYTSKLIGKQVKLGIINHSEWVLLPECWNEV